MSQLENKHEKLVVFTKNILKLFKSYIEYNQSIVTKFKNLQIISMDLDLNDEILLDDSTMQSQAHHQVDNENNQNITNGNTDSFFQNNTSLNEYFDDFNELVENQNDIDSESNSQENDYDPDTVNISEMIGDSQLVKHEHFSDNEQDIYRGNEIFEAKTSKKSGVKRQRKKKIMCTVCNKYFHSPSHLKVHMRIHSNERPFECPTCHMTFTASGNLKVHQRVHTGERPFPCDQCHMTFKLQHHLKDHMKSHTKLNSSHIDNKSGIEIENNLLFSSNPDLENNSGILNEFGNPDLEIC